MKEAEKYLKQSIDASEEFFDIKSTFDEKMSSVLGMIEPALLAYESCSRDKTEALSNGNLS